MGTMIVRELDTIARCRALAAAISVHAAVLIAFALAWGDGRGLSSLSTATFYDQAQAVEALLLLVLLPWTAARCVAVERGDDLVLLSAVTGVRPSRLILARAVAVIAALWVVVLSGLPVLFMALRISAATWPHAAVGETELLALTFVACGALLVSRHVCHDRTRGWMVAAIATGVLGVLVRLSSPLGTAALLTACGAAAVWLLAIRADTSLRYLSEQRT